MPKDFSMSKYVFLCGLHHVGLPKIEITGINRGKQFIRYAISHNIRKLGRIILHFCRDCSQYFFFSIKDPVYFVSG